MPESVSERTGVLQRREPLPGRGRPFAVTPGWHLAARINLLLTAAMVAAGCAAGTSTLPPSPNPTASARMTPAATPTMCQEAGLTVDMGPYWMVGWYEHGTLPWMSPPPTSDDAGLRSVIVAAEVLAEGDGFRAAGCPHAWPDGLIFTRYTVRVFMVLHGDAGLGDMPVAVEGGTAGCVRVSVDIAPRVQVGSRYVLFLGAPVESLPLTRQLWEAWPIWGSDTVQTLAGPMPLADLAGRIARLAGLSSPTPAGASSARP